MERHSGALERAWRHSITSLASAELVRRASERTCDQAELLFESGTLGLRDLLYARRDCTEARAAERDAALTVKIYEIEIQSLGGVRAFLNP